jgi:cytochrome c5
MAHTQHTATETAGLSSNMVAAVLILNLIIFGGILYARTLPPRPEPEQSLSVAYVQTQASIPLPTAIPLITETPVMVAKPRPFYPDPQRVRVGETVFQSVCSACHGFSAQGISGLGPSMINNAFIDSKSNDALLAFIISGRPADHPENKSGVSMPARGGNTTLTDNDLNNVINYIRNLNPNVVVYQSDPEGGTTGDVQEVVVPPTATPILATVTPIEFKPLDLSNLGGLGSSATATPTP